MSNALSDWLDRLETMDPTRIEMGLDRVSRVFEQLNIDVSDVKIVTVTGTNGKGTCSCAAAEILMEAGKQVGLYTSPHIDFFGERIRVNGETALPTDLVEAFEVVEAARGDTELTYFEFTTLAAFVLFQRADLDVWVLEVGLGGRLDAVNVIDTDVAVITSIGLDHQDWLGTSLHSVASEKVGIARADKPLVLGTAGLPPVLKRVASELNAPLYEADTDFDAYTETHIGAPTGWSWQGKDGNGRFHLFNGIPYKYLNINSLGAAIQAALLVDPEIPESCVKQALDRVRLPGRFQTYLIDGGVRIILDVAHNPAAGESLRDQLRQQPCAGNTRCVIAMAEDKDHAQFVATIGPEINEWYVCNLPSPRSWDGAAVQKNILPGAYFFPQASIAVANAVARSRDGDRVLIVGSFMLLSAVNDLEELH